MGKLRLCIFTASKSCRAYQRHDSDPPVLLASHAWVAPYPGLVSRERLEAWLAEHDWKPETRRSAQGVAHQFFKFLVEDGILKDSPAKFLKLVHVPDGVPHPAAESAVRHALQNAPKRTALIVRFAVPCGLKGVRDLHFARKRLGWWTAESKGQRWKSSGYSVAGFHADLQPRELSRLAIFPGRIDGHLSAQYTAKLLDSVLPPGVTGHSLRHRFGTVAYRATHDLLAVGAVMGHVKTDTTKRYIKLDLDPLTRAVQAAQL